jgi:hypothetical protein
MGEGCEEFFFVAVVEFASSVGNAAQGFVFSVFRLNGFCDHEGI